MNILIKYFVAIILYFIVFVANAQTTKNSLLWKIEGDSIKTSYLFGTIHLIPQEDFKILPKVKRAFDTSEIVTLEIDMADPNFFKEVVQHSYLKEGEELKSFMDDGEYTLLDTYLKKHTKTGMIAYKKSKPFLLMSTLMTTMAGKNITSYELSLIGMAKQANKEIEGLETFASQIAIFDSQPYDEQIDGLIEMLDDPKKMNDLYSKMVTFYKEENIQGLYDYMDKYLGEDPEMTKKLLDDRNVNWIGKITEYSKKNKVFYAVGAGHLAGKSGVINLLKKEGYTVTPILK